MTEPAQLDPRPPERPGPGSVKSTAVAAVAVFTLLVTACGGGGPGSAVKSATYQKALAYSQCMHSHGVPGPAASTARSMGRASLRTDHAGHRIALYARPRTNAARV